MIVRLIKVFWLSVQKCVLKIIVERFVKLLLPPTRRRDWLEPQPCTGIKLGRWFEAKHCAKMLVDFLTRLV